ncbi:hypothetical protein L2E82_35502 [Cichorium intybus]|uniref:Uncharacterized protein n=1 Tax=Cichorium intybus TaxID=13427 RepID=A0ACB9BP39_CICIN|nr:hypothetical protein L2E82_35502 [Cichorium intybus]
MSWRYKFSPPSRDFVPEIMQRVEAVLSSGQTPSWVVPGTISGPANGLSQLLSSNLEYDTIPPEMDNLLVFRQGLLCKFQAYLLESASFCRLVHQYTTCALLSVLPESFSDNANTGASHKSGGNSGSSLEETSENSFKVSHFYRRFT